VRVLVTGGAGYIGSVVTEELLAAGHTVFIVDNLCKGHAESIPREAVSRFIDIADYAAIHSFMSEARIEAVVHMAAYSQVGESVHSPGKYYQNNVTGSLKLLDAMVACNVRYIVFSSTAAVYGEPAKQPIEEDDPVRPTNPYGESKLAIERALPWYESACGIRSASLRYFNAAGATERCGEFHQPETHLIPLLLQTATGERNVFDLYGDDYPTRDGTCIRDYIHVSDIARAHVQVLDALDRRSVIYNLGNGAAAYTVREVLQSVEKITGNRIAVRVVPRRPGDPAVLMASSEKIRRELQWNPQYQDIDSIVESAWKWKQSHSEGYAIVRS